MRNTQVWLYHYIMILGGLITKNLRFSDIYVLVPLFVYVACFCFFIWRSLSLYATSWTDLRWRVAFIYPSEK